MRCTLGASASFYHSWITYVVANAYEIILIRFNELCMRFGVQPTHHGEMEQPKTLLIDNVFDSTEY